jgi:hypothetical protein
VRLHFGTCSSKQHNSEVSKGVGYFIVPLSVCLSMRQYRIPVADTAQDCVPMQQSMQLTS